MKLSYSFVLACAVITLGSVSNTVLGQGSLTPPGAPSPTMKSLSQIEPRTPISSLPYTISTPGSYYLTTNQTGSAVAIAINSGNVTLDLNGFTVQGGTSYGIAINGNYTNIIVRNGTIANFAGNGVDGYTYGYPRNVLFENLTVSGCGNRGIATYYDSVIRNCRVYGTSGLGIYTYGGQIVDCITRSNAAGGIFGYSAVIRNCHSEANYSSGIECNVGSILDSESFNNTGYGIQLYGGASVRRCHVQGNTSAGIYAPNYSPFLGGVIADCVVTTNYYGIDLASPGYLVTGNEIAYNPNAGIIISSSNNRIDGNHIAVLAGYYGIELFNGTSFVNNVIVRNSVFGGGSVGINYYIVGTNNDVGPIGNASTNTSPWANFSH